MQFGLCGGMDLLSQAAALGFDYLEPSATDVARMTDAAFADALAAVRRSPVPTPAFNCLFPGDFRLLADDADRAEIAAWLDRALGRASRLGAEVVVFGSGAARTRPDAMPWDEAFRRLVSVTRLIGDAAEAHGVTVVIEPLRRAETNMINSVGEGACLMAAAGHPRVRLLADYYHIISDGEQPGDLARVGGVRHTHIAAKEGRRWPLQADDGIRAFLRALRAAGYDARMSVEGRSDDIAADAAVTLPLLRALWAEEA